jgi:outer membrane lipoprotein carrier protein
MKKFILLLLISLSAFSAEQPAVVQEIQKSFKALQTIETNFDQTIRSTRFSDKKASGKLYLQRPGKMIWNYDQPKGKVFAADGKLITMYDPEEKQALISNQPKGSKLPTAFSFLMGEGNLQDHFTIDVASDSKNAQGQRQVTLVCKPKGNTMEFTLLELTFIWKDGIILQSSKTRDVMNSENQIDFSAMKINPKLSTTIFDVKLPKGTPIVTANDLGPQ